MAWFRVFTVIFLIGWLFVLSLPAAEAQKRSLPMEIASFDGGVITSEDLMERLLEFAALPAYRDVVGATFLRVRLITAEAERLGLRVRPEALAEEFARMKKSAGGLEALRREMLQNRLNWYSLAASIEDALLIRDVARKTLGRDPAAELSDEDIRSCLKTLRTKYKPRFFGYQGRRIAAFGDTDLFLDDLLQFFAQRSSSEFLRQQIDSIALDKMVLHEAQKLNIQISPLDLENAVVRIRKQLKLSALRGTDRRRRVSLGQLLASKGQSEEQLKKNLSLRALAVRLRMLSSFLVDTELQALYNKRREEFRIVQAAHVLFPFHPRAPYAVGDVSEDDTKRVAAESSALVKKLNGIAGYPAIREDEFLECANRFAKEGGAVIGGPLGFIIRNPALAEVVSPSAYGLDYLKGPEGEMISPISKLQEKLTDRLFAMEDGSVGGVVPMPYGSHIFYRSDSLLPANWKAVEDILYEMQLVAKEEELEENLRKEYPLTYLWKPWEGRLPNALTE
jgi:hypothetical protein